MTLQEKIEQLFTQTEFDANDHETFNDFKTALREGAIRSARELAEASRTKAQAASDEFDARTRAARAEVYHQMDEKRRAALERRAELVAATRREIEQTVHEASDRLRGQTAAARQQIGRDADALAATIVERVLGRKAS